MPRYNRQMAIFSGCRGSWTTLPRFSLDGSSILEQFTLVTHDVGLYICGSQSQAVFARRRSKSKLKLLDIREERKRREKTEVREQASPSRIHGNPSVRE
ncbi:hypothetical protein TNCV_4649741 [Trichonephila clavipes]|uniref:Uncharacterized protein n=1 Tax=Trichonephila clavipes TaxID=2585209 RepID=A0A8X6VN60_TRICX|nr:hypothetical protein TNCV_4649741 [Trichonephila clavipes]